MGYGHSYGLGTDFTEEFLADVRRLVTQYERILSDVTIEKNSIRLNGVGQMGYETFRLAGTSGDDCKTDVREYDEVVCGILLLATYHFPNDFEVYSAGLVVPADKLTQDKLGGYWVEALERVQMLFGYTFTMERLVDPEEEKKDQSYIHWWSVKFIPNKNAQ